jgi:hypothetical protein
MEMTLADIYTEFTTGSQGFVKAVSSHCGFDISNREIRRISTKAETAEQFQAIWANEDWWTDENNASVEFE